MGWCTMNYVNDERFDEVSRFLRDRANINLHADPFQENYVRRLLDPVRKTRSVFVDAEAGTGKTSLAMLTGYNQVEAGKFEQIIYVRGPVSVVEMGFLPGDLAEKEMPYLMAGIEALQKADKENANFIESLILNDKLKVTTSAFLRGIDWDTPSFIVIDEAQNLSLHELQTILTRPHDSSKIVVIGSTKQIDNKSSALTRIGNTQISAFELYKIHFTQLVNDGTNVECKLMINHRGTFSKLADQINHTVKHLEAMEIENEENYFKIGKSEYTLPSSEPSNEEWVKAYELIGKTSDGNIPRKRD